MIQCRIVYVVGQLGRGGLERQLSYLLQAMDRERYKPAVVVWRYSLDDVYVREIRDLGVPIYGFPTGASKAAKLRKFRALSQRLRPEVIHSYGFHTNFAAQWAALGTRAIAIGSLRGDFLRSKKESGLWLGCLSAGWPRYQISNSLISAQKAERSKSFCRPKRIHVVKNGVDLARFRDVDCTAIRRKVIIGIGSLICIKRWDRVLTVVRQLKDRGIDCRVKIVGDGPQRNALQRTADDLGILANVEFLGDISDVATVLKNCRFVVHTSETEGCPNAVMEAMASGRPVVAMEAGDIPLLVEDGKTGFLIRQGDEETFSQRVMQLLSDDEVCRRMGLAASAKADREFGLERLVSETLEVYRAAGWKDGQNC